MSLIGVRSMLAALACGGAAAVLLAATPARGASGGTGAPGASSSAGPTVVPGATARLVRGKAIPPASAPPAVKQVIWAANRIRNKPYRYGGGHGSFQSRGYDCSGAVSYALRGARFLDSPLDSRALKRWGERGRGGWITVYSNRHHAYAVIAGLRWDTSGNRRSTGPSWFKRKRSPARGPYVARHPGGY